MFRSEFYSKLPLPLLFIVRSVIILSLSLAFCLLFPIGFLFGKKGRPRILRLYLQLSGSIFIKLGQFLAMRYDLLPMNYCEELSGLLDRVPPVRPARILKLIRADMGRPAEEVFAEFEHKPLASASIAQVHRARLKTGEKVVVKVIRPGNRKQFRIDFLYLRWVSSFMDGLGLLGRIDVGKIMKELIQLTREELDFKREARNIQRMHDLMEQDDIAHYAPATYPEYSGPNMITMEWIEGVTVNELLEAMEAKDEEKLAKWAEEGISPRRTSRILFRSILEQAIRHRWFHADPHAANLIVMKGGRLAWVDFGMLGWLDERLWDLQFKLRVAISAKKTHEAYQHLLSTLEPLPVADLSEFEAEVKEYIRDWIVHSEDPSASIQEKSSGYFFLRLFDAIRRARLSLPLGLSRLYRAIIIADMAMFKLDPELDWLPLMSDFIREEQARQTERLIRESLDPVQLAAGVSSLINFPKAAASLTEWLNQRLPEISRATRNQLSRFERLTLIGLRYIRIFVFLSVLIVLGAEFVAPRFFMKQGWGALDQFLSDYWIPMLVFGILAWLFLNRIIGEYRKYDR